MLKLKMNKLTTILLAVTLLISSGCSDSNPTVPVTVPATGASFSQTVATPINTPITIVVQGADISMINVDAQPANGFLTGELSGVAPTMTYTPNIDYVGTDIITLNVTATDGTTSVGTVNIQVLDSVLPTTDSDGDGLLDLAELNRYGTNPSLSDTDGDGFTDFEEVVTFAFDKNVNNFRFNPLIADMPEVDIQLVSQPEIQLNYTTTDGTSSTISTNRSVSSSNSWSHSKAESSTWSTSVSHEAGVSLTVGVKTEVQVGLFGGAGTEVSAEVTGHYTNTNTEGHETSTSWTDETAGENATANDQGESFEENNSISSSDGEVLVSVKVVNNGDVAYTLNNLFLNASYFDQASDQPFVPIGSLQFDDPTNSQFPAFTLSPGQATGVMTFKTSSLNINTVKKLLTNSRGMSIQPSIMELLDQDGVSYNFASTGIGSQSALVKIDYIGNGGRENITKRVAVHGDPSQSVSVEKILNNILNVNAVVTDAIGNVSTQGVINAVDSLTNNGQSGFWIMIHGENQGNNKMVTTTYTTPDDRARWIMRGNLDPNTPAIVDDYDLSQITINSGDILHLFYMQDSDLDGVPDVQEFFYRSDPLVADTDNDGLDDSTEIKGWDISWQNNVGSTLTARVYSSPTLADTDGDGVSDFDEANLADANLLNRRNPRSKDTDGDSIVDSIDDKTGGILGNNVYQNLNISALATTVTPVVGLNADVDVSFTLPDSLHLMPNNGYSEYSVAVYRLVDATATFSPPATKPLNGVLPILGDTLPCEIGGLCQWQAVSVYNTSAGAANQPVGPVATHTFTETALLPANTSAKYIAYISVNNTWKEATVDTLATSNAEIIRFTMHPGLISNAKTLVGPNHHATTTGNISGRHDSTNPGWYYYPKNNPGYQWSNGAWTQSSYAPPWPLSPWESPTRTAETYDRYDVNFGFGRDLGRRGSDVDVGSKHFVVDIGGQVIEDTPADYWEAPIAYPYFKGDGQVDLRWWLIVGGKYLYDSGVKTIDGTYHVNLAASRATPFVDAVPMSGGVPVYTTGATSVFVNQTDAGYTYPAQGVFEIELPAVEQCYRVDVGENEIDANLPGGINQTIDYDAHALLCRDNSPAGSGTWTLTSVATGQVLGSTRKGNISPVTFNGYVYWREVPPTDQSVPWTHDTSWHAVSKAFDLNMGYDMIVR